MENRMQTGAFWPQSGQLQPPSLQSTPPMTEATRQLSAAVYWSSELRHYLFKNIVWAKNYEIGDALGINLLPVVAHSLIAQKKINRLLIWRISLLLLSLLSIGLFLFFQIHSAPFTWPQVLLGCLGIGVFFYSIAWITVFIEVRTGYIQIKEQCFSRNEPLNIVERSGMKPELIAKIKDAQESPVAIVSPAAETLNIPGNDYEPIQVIRTPLAFLGWKLRDVSQPYSTIDFKENRQNPGKPLIPFTLTEFYATVKREVQQYFPDHLLVKERLYVSGEDIPAHLLHDDPTHPRPNIDNHISVYKERPAETIKYYLCFHLIPPSGGLIFSLCFHAILTDVSLQIQQEAFLLTPVNEHFLVDTAHKLDWKIRFLLVGKTFSAAWSRWLQTPREGSFYLWQWCKSKILQGDTFFQRKYEKRSQMKHKGGASTSLRYDISDDPEALIGPDIEAPLRRAQELMTITQRVIIRFLQSKNIDTRWLQDHLPQVVTLSPTVIQNINNGYMHNGNIKTERDANLNIFSPGPRPPQQPSPAAPKQPASPPPTNIPQGYAPPQAGYAAPQGYRPPQNYMLPPSSYATPNVGLPLPANNTPNYTPPPIVNLSEYYGPGPNTPLPNNNSPPYGNNPNQHL